MKWNQPQADVEQSAKNIKLLLLDVDGVLTDGKLYISTSGEESKAFNTQDGHGIRMLMAQGVMVGIITGRNSAAVTTRATDLGIEILYQGQQNKLEALSDILQKHSLAATEIAYAGDDLPDLPIMKEVGLSFAVANAHSSIATEASCQTLQSGGNGAVREICDFLLRFSDQIS